MTPAEAARLIAGVVPRTQGTEPLHPLSLAVLLALQVPGELSTMEVVDVLALPSIGTLTPYLQALQAAGYIDRRRHRFDHRKTMCAITPKGRQLLRSARRPLDGSSDGQCEAAGAAGGASGAGGGPASID
jgi:DNA-binding MarR family transcriptional regulator